MSRRAPGNPEEGLGHQPPLDGAGRPAVPAARGDGAPRHLPSLLASLCERLPEDRTVEWERALARASGPEDPSLLRFVAAQQAAGLAERLRQIVAAWRREAPGMPGAALAFALATARELPRPLPAVPVVTGPLSPATPARLTSSVVLDVVRSAKSSLLLCSFAAHGVDSLMTEVAAAVRRGVQVDLLLEETTRAAAAFSGLPPEIRIWHRTAATGVLHAKLIAADRHTAFLGSANLTDRALKENIELGVIIRDTAEVAPLVDHFQWLIAPGTGLMRLA
ncbi:DISARM system phospholipase D-like protein DrmC [Streptomyces griseoaurantiacus]|uniref:DISARM system phospholipase D-like protein DrmC n=1 Tax=Streptomyces griseoaurantiacus TaxID=68213 RepID=UPI002E2C0F96|nr:DISARM system phospholipase D-like protein DrmC [Streptomyces jietaisiensis]